MKQTLSYFFYEIMYKFNKKKLQQIYQNQLFKTTNSITNGFGETFTSDYLYTDNKGKKE